MIESRTEERGLVMKLTISRLDAAVAPKFREIVLRDVGAQPTLVLDLSEVSFVDSTGLGCIVAVLKRLPPGGSLRLVGVHERVVAILRLTRLENVFKRFATVHDALAA
jgi:anti-sigma B factor antagonist